MTLLDILQEVQEGVNKLPPLTEYPGTSCDILNSIILFKWNSHENKHEHLYKYAKDIVVYGVQLMQLADANMEKAALVRVPQESCRSCPQVVLCDGAIKAKECTWWTRDKTPKDNPTTENCKESDYLSEVIGIVNELAKINNLRMIRR